MGIFEIITISVGLAMDAFAVSICKGLSLKKMNWKNAVVTGLYFGIFQGIMPLIGYLLGISFESYIVSFDHWITFVLLLFIGGKMIKESQCEEDDVHTDTSFTMKAMLPLAIATSIDALAVGITFAFLKVDIVFPVLSIGVITFFFGVIGVKIGNVFGEKFKSRAEFFGGVILILIGTKILLEHLGIL